MPFNDPMLSQQWHYNNEGENGFTAGADINLFEAWKVETGKPNVIVSVHDQGIVLDHEDLGGPYLGERGRDERCGRCR